jgi:hypothetical protein
MRFSHRLNTRCNGGKAIQDVRIGNSVAAFLCAVDAKEALDDLSCLLGSDLDRGANNGLIFIDRG